MAKKIDTVFFIVAVCSIVIAGFVGYSFRGDVSSSEITGLTSEYKNEKSLLELQIDGLQRQLQDLQDQTDNLQSDWQMYDKLMIKGLGEYVEAVGNKGYAESDYVSASINYDANYFDVSKSYADSADIIYATASIYYRDAKAYFNQALNYAPNEKLYEITELYYNVSLLGAEIMDAMHQACEYFSTACNSYNKGWWDTGDDAITTMGEFIETHDELVPDFNDYLSEIAALLDTI